MLMHALSGELAAMKEFFDRSTRVLEEADSGYAPKPDLFTVSQMVAHVAQTVEWFFKGAFAAEGFAMNFEEMDKQVRACTSLKAAREWLDRAVQTGAATINAHSEDEWKAPLPPGPIMGGLPRLAILGSITDHSAHHRGALTVYSRLLNKVPPMPYMEM